MSDYRRYRGKRPNNKKPNAENAANKANTQAPHPQYENATVLEMAVEKKLTEETLVRAVGISWNKYAWFAEREASLQEGSPEYIACCDNTDSWENEYLKMTERLKAFIGLDGNSPFALPELTILMNKYGFEDIDGTWRKKQS